jgi:hypothetical protein
MTMTTTMSKKIYYLLYYYYSIIIIQYTMLDFNTVKHVVWIHAIHISYVLNAGSAATRKLRPTSFEEAFFVCCCQVKPWTSLFW